MIHVEGRAETFQQQLQRLQQAEQQVRSGALLSSAQVVFKRYLLSDSTNQVPLIHDGDACTYPSYSSRHSTVANSPCGSIW